MNCAATRCVGIGRWGGRSGGRGRRARRGPASERTAAPAGEGRGSGAPTIGRAGRQGEQGSADDDFKVAGRASEGASRTAARAA